MDSTDDWPIWATGNPSADNRYDLCQIYFRASIMTLTPVKDKPLSSSSGAISNFRVLRETGKAIVSSRPTLNIYMPPSAVALAAPFVVPKVRFRHQGMVVARMQRSRRISVSNRAARCAVMPAKHDRQPESSGFRSGNRRYAKSRSD
jgi:hypothetical protein